MGQYAGQSQWIDEVYQWEQTDPVQGGPNGIDNVPIKNLADRTQWLKDQMGLINRLEGEAVLTAGAPITNNLSGHLITMYANNAINNFQLDDVHNFEPGSIIPFLSFANPNSVNNILTFAGQSIFSTDGGITTLSAHHKEQLFLIALTDHWKVIYGPGNFNCVGEEVKGRKQLNNALILQGQLLRRDQYPRLWAWVQANFTMGQGLTTDFAWNVNGLNYQGWFSTGDGVSTFRLPDERGMFERMLDLGRGVDILRQSNFPGSYEQDFLQNHKHPYIDRYFAESQDQMTHANKWVILPDNRDNIGSGRSDLGNNAAPYVDDNTGNNPGGAGETTVKNIAKLNQIKY